MKKITYILLLNIIFINVLGQDFSMYVGGKKYFYKISPTQILIGSDRCDTAYLKTIIETHTEKPVLKIESIDEKLLLIEIGQCNIPKLLHLLKNKSKNIFSYISPVIVDDNAKNIGGFTNEIYVRLKKSEDYQLLLYHKAQYRINSINKCNFDDRTFLLSLDYSSEKNAMQVANELYESGLYEYTEPNLIHFMEFSTNDEYYDLQWALDNNGQFGGLRGIDINANLAWEITSGTPNIIVSILDTGVDLLHPDLSNNLVPGLDATGGNNNGSVLNALAHGTACAGIVAARGNNTSGIIGVAHGCKIQPISIAGKSFGWTATESGYIARAIDWLGLIMQVLCQCLFPV